MLQKVFAIFLLFFFHGYSGQSQTACGTLGQNPSTAFPVCGTADFFQDSVPVCGGRVIPSQCPLLGGYFPFTDKNPFWYKFTCFSSGTLGFTLTPNTFLEDYDWQLFDVTNHNPDDVFDSLSLFVACDWSGDFGITGAAAAPLGISLVNCEGPGVPLFSSMPTLIAGHNYLLLVSHFSDTQSGYTLSFGGGTAVITDPKDPHLQSAEAACDGTSITIALNKKMRCSSLTASGSEFSLLPPLANIIAAKGNNCTSGFDMDSVMLTLASPLPPGNYDIRIQNGLDANTLTDNCGVFVPVGETIPMTVFPFIATPMDSITTLGCAPDKLDLYFRKGMQCSTIAADGSDFMVTGPYPVTVVGATGNCAGGLTRNISVQLSGPLQKQGSFQLILRVGSDGNTILNDCSQPTPAGATLNFQVKDTVNANFGYTLLYGCRTDTVNYFHNGANGVNFWKWNFDNLRSSSLQNPVFRYNIFGLHQTSLIVSNGVCSDTSAQLPVMLDNMMKADFEATAMVCPGDPASFKDKSTGNIVAWSWTFGNGNNSLQQQPPPQVYKPINSNTNVPVKLVIKNNLGCFDSTIKTVGIGGDCLIAVPGAFTPNNDGLNDYLYPLNAYKVLGLLFRVYNRFGQLMFETRNWNIRWNGSFKGQGADAGSYVWMLQYIDPNNGKLVKQKGSSLLIR